MTDIKLTYWRDEDAESPLEWSDWATVSCYRHRRYDLGNAVYDGQPPPKDAVAAVPLYFFEHSGVAMSTKPFNDKWDSAFCGYAWVTRDKALEFFDVKPGADGKRRLPRNAKKRLTAALEGLIEEYSKYLNGEVYGFTVKLSKDVFGSTLERVDEELDSCGGYFGLESVEEAMRHALKRPDVRDLLAIDGVTGDEALNALVRDAEAE